MYSSSMAGSLVVGRANSVNQTFLPHLPGEMVLIMIMMVVGLSGFPCFVIGNDHICSDHSRNERDDLHQGHL